VTVSHGCRGVAARACGLVNLEPTKVAYALALCSELIRDANLLLLEEFLL